MARRPAEEEVREVDGRSEDEGGADEESHSGKNALL